MASTNQDFIPAGQDTGGLGSGFKDFVPTPPAAPESVKEVVVENKEDLSLLTKKELIAKYESLTGVKVEGKPNNETLIQMINDVSTEKVSGETSVEEENATPSVEVEEKTPEVEIPAPVEEVSIPEPEVGPVVSVNTPATPVEEENSVEESPVKESIEDSVETPEGEDKPVEQ